MSEYQWEPEQYELLDFGGGRKLERLGDLVLDRYCPAADRSEKKRSELWRGAQRVCRDGSVRPADAPRGNAQGGSSPQGQRPSVERINDWYICCGQLRFQLKLTPFGHVGVFPEQVGNWQWLDQSVRDLREDLGRAPKALNLFAYTGGSTMALAAAGAEVVHVDASAPAVQWARRNAEASELADRPIRWIVEDAPKFVQREIRRGNFYDIVVLDPPSFGHGPKGQRWEIQTDLPDLISGCNELLRSGQGCVLFSAHCDSPDEWQVAEMLSAASGKVSKQAVETLRLSLPDQSGRALDAGFAVRWSSFGSK